MFSLRRRCIATGEADAGLSATGDGVAEWPPVSRPLGGVLDLDLDFADRN